MLPSYSGVNSNLVRRNKDVEIPYQHDRNHQEREGRKNSFIKLKEGPTVAIFCVLLFVLFVWFVWFMQSDIKLDELPQNDEPIVSVEPTQTVNDQDIFQLIAKLLTNPDQSREGSYGWYSEQLSRNKLGNTVFDDPVMTKLGFQDTLVTSKEFFYYFRTFNTTERCLGQHTSRLYAEKTAGEYEENGANLDAVLVHCSYNPPFFLNTIDQQTKNIDVLHTIVKAPKNVLQEDSLLVHSNNVDYLFGESMWRGMRRLSIFMCSEALIDSQIQRHIQRKNDPGSMERFSESTADISVCFLSTCSVWVNYLYQNIETSKSNVFGKNPFSQNKGICAFISNCDRGGTELKERYEMLQTLSEYLPIKQFGRCGNNAKEGPGGKQFELENNCRFYFAAENSLVKDYVTEKFFEGIKAITNGGKMLMIYRGAPNIKDLGFPSSVFINHDEYGSVDELGKYLKLLNEDDELFEKRFSEINQDRKKIDDAIQRFNFKLGGNIPCRMCSAIGEMKLARYLLFKIGLRPTKNKVNFSEWEEFKNKFSNLGKERLKILDEIYMMAFQIFQTEGNNQNKFNNGWKFNY